MRPLIIVIAMLVFAVTSFAVGSRNCDVSKVPFAVDVNKIYDPQFSGWREAVKGETISVSLNIGNTFPGQTIIIEVNDLPDGLTCTSGLFPKITGVVTKPGLWYSRYWVHNSGSTVKTDFNRGVIVFKVYDVNDVNLPYVEMMCGN